MSRLYPPGVEPHDPTKCHWKLVKRGSANSTAVDTYRCEHGWISEGHPRGWCDQGCCR